MLRHFNGDSMEENIFISFYYEADYTFAVAIRDYLKKRDYHVLNLEDEKVDEQQLIKWINRQIKASNITILIISELTYTRKYVLYEIEESIKQGNIIVPISIKRETKLINPLSTYCLDNTYPICEIDDVEHLEELEAYIKIQTGK